MSVISKWMCELTEWMETVSRGMVEQAKRIEELEDRADGLEGSSNELRNREMEILERIDMLETGGMFGKGMLARLTKLEDWKQDCESSGITPDPFGKYADGYPPVGHPDRRDTQTPKPSQPELVKGFWYKYYSDLFVIDKVNSVMIDGVENGYISGTCPDGGHIVRPRKYTIPATLDDLAHEVEGVKVWMVEHNNGNILLYRSGEISFLGMAMWGVSGGVDERPIARHIAEKCGWCIITEEQWELLTKEAAK